MSALELCGARNPAGLCGVATTHRGLEWLARRRDGESVALIAWRDGVSPDTVKRATAPYGPFVRASRHLGRTITASTALDERTRRWVRARQRGARVSDIARREGVAHQVVSRYTAEAGPFPSPDVVQEWVDARRADRTVEAIAAEYGAPEGLVRRATRAWGPFFSQSRLPAGVVGVTGIARLAGVSGPAALRWVRTGRVPAADFVIGDGRQLWLETTITRWLGEADLATCPQCGARCLSLGQHRAGAHRSPPGALLAPDEEPAQH